MARALSVEGGTASAVIGQNAIDDFSDLAGQGSSSIAGERNFKDLPGQTSSERSAGIKLRT